MLSGRRGTVQLQARFFLKNKKSICICMRRTESIISTPQRPLLVLGVRAGVRLDLVPLAVLAGAVRPRAVGEGGERDRAGAEGRGAVRGGRLRGGGAVAARRRGGKRRARVSQDIRPCFSPLLFNSSVNVHKLFFFV